TLTAKLANSSGAVVVGQAIDFMVDGNAVGSGTTGVNGLATVSYTIPIGTLVGSHSITAAFGGSSNYLATTGSGKLTVNKNPVKLTVTKVTGHAGATATLSAKLTDSALVPLTNATLNFSV